MIKIGFGITSLVTGERVYVGPFDSVAKCRAEMRKCLGKNKWIVHREKFDIKSAPIPIIMG